MNHRTLGRTDIRISEVSLGTWGLASDAYGPPSPERFREVVTRALEAGITTFDLAPVWGDGASERVVGEIVKEKRDEVQLITRAGAAIDGGELAHRFDAESLRADCEASLERLGTDHIDVWLLHDPPDEVLERDDLKEVPGKLEEEGKIRTWGVSVGDVDQARMAIARGAKTICLVYNLLLGDDLHDLAGEVSIAGTGVLARSPLAYGLLAGRWSGERVFPEGDHRRDRWSREALRTRVRQVEALRFLVHGKAGSMGQAAIRYVLANAVVSSAIVGARTVGQVSDAAACSDGPPYLPDDDLVRLPQVLAAVGA